jgi:hypothetical protein
VAHDRFLQSRPGHAHGPAFRRGGPQFAFCQFFPGFDGHIPKRHGHLTQTHGITLHDSRFQKADAPGFVQIDPFRPI